VIFSFCFYYSGKSESFGSTVQDSDLIDGRMVHIEMPLEFAKHQCYKTVPNVSMQEGSENEEADKLVPASPTSSLIPGEPLGLSRRVTSAYFTGHGVSKTVSNTHHDSDVRDNEVRKVHSSSSVQSEPTVMYKSICNERTEEEVPPQFDDKKSSRLMSVTWSAKLFPVTKMCSR
jgi:hypothetical protein